MMMMLLDGTEVQDEAWADEWRAAVTLGPL